MTEKLKMHTKNRADENFKALISLFPNAVTETIDENGVVVRAIDKDVLMQEISVTVVEGRDERYQFTWPDKRKSVLLANSPISKTLRPCREESVDFDTTQNLYIEGDNLDVLKLLQETYLGKIKMIYIDPPYNTGNDFIYEDHFALSADEYLANSGQFDDEGNRLVANTESNGRFHTDWLNMIYPRLLIAKDLLSQDGVIAISIGYQEVHNLVKICQELYSNKQIMPITIQTSGGKINGCFNIVHEYLVIIAPVDFNAISTEEDKNSYSSPYHGMTLATYNQVQRPNQTYPIFVNKNGCIVGCGKSLQERIEENIYQGDPRDFIFDFNEAPKGTVAIWPITNKGEHCVWRLISSRLLSDWERGFIKVIPNKTGKNKYSIQYLSEGIIEKIQSNKLSTYKLYDDVSIPTLEINDYKTDGSGISTIWTDKEFYTSKGGEQVRQIFNQKNFSYPKPLSLIKYILKRVVDPQSIVLDLFSGSATTAHAVMQLNAEDGGNRKFIMVQIPEKTEEKSEAFKAGYTTISDIGKERIRRAGTQIKNELRKKATGQTTLDGDSPVQNPDTLDIGFRVLKLDTTNMEEVFYTPEEYTKTHLAGTEDNIKKDRTQEDLLFQVMLELGVPLSGKITTEKVDECDVFSVEDNYLYACFDDNISETVIKAIAEKKPYYAVFRDSGMANDAVLTNFDQIFAAISPTTKRKVL